ncbi:MAG: HAD family phosphatase [Firmicutes bacterium]|nr:HAD family phosphatase [Bacillota bacterium]
MVHAEPKLIGFDLDGTLTQHKTPLEPRNNAVLEMLKRQYMVVMVAAGSCKRVYTQLNEFPIDIIGNYGMQESRVIDTDSGKRFELIRDEKADIDREKTYARVEKIRDLTNYTDITGDEVEFHRSGVITFPLLGTKADPLRKLSFDPDRQKRREIYQLVFEMFPEYNVFIGGTSSFDIVPKPYDKFYALTSYADQRRVPMDRIIYVGDDFGPGGNDEPLMKSGIECINIENYQHLPDVLAEHLNDSLLADARNDSQVHR